MSQPTHLNKNNRKRSLFACLVGPFFPQPTDIFDKGESNWKRITLWKWSKQSDEYVLVQFVLVSNITNVISFVTFYHKLGELSNDDGDGNKNGKKSVGLDWQNNNFARASRFLYISLPSYEYNVRVLNFTFCRGQEHKTTIFFFFS